MMPGPNPTTAGRGPGHSGPVGRGGPMAMMKGETARNFRGTMRRLVRYLSDYRISLIVVILFALGSTIFSIIGPRVLGLATTKLYEGVMAQMAGLGSIDFGAIGQIILICACIYLFSAVLGYIQGWIMTDISMKITYRFRRDLSQKFNHLPLSYFDKTSHGEVLSRITNDVDTVSQTLNQVSSQIITSVTTVIGVLVMMLTISWQMTLVALVILPLSFLVIRFIVTALKLFNAPAGSARHVNGHVEEMYGGHNVIKLSMARRKASASSMG